MARDAGLRRGKLAAIALTSAVLIVSPTAWQNLAWSFQTCFVISVLAVAGACAAMPALLRKQSVAALIGAAALCIVSAFSLANGLLAAPLLAAGAALHRKWAATLTLAAVAGALWIAHAFMPGRALPAIAGAGDIGAAAQYFLTFLGSPIGVVFDSIAGSAPASLRVILIQAAGGLALALTFWALLSTYKSRNAGAFALALLAAFVVVSAATVARGRFPSGVEHAEASRYLTYSGALYAALAAILLHRLNGASYAKLTQWAASMALAVALLAFVCAGTKYVSAAYETQTALIRARSTLVTNAKDGRALERVMFSAFDARVSAIALRNDRRGFFASPWTHKLGEHIDTNALPACDGRTRAMRFSPGRQYWFLRGSIADSAFGGRTPRRLAFTNASGTMIGYGEFLRRPIPPFRHMFGEGDRLSWAGHVLGDDPFPVTPIAVADERPLCRLAPIARRPQRNDARADE
jgi:hypothetical protein